jgi:hypothetical protein
MFKYWSTLCNVPVRTTSFFSSTATSFPTSVLKKDRKIWELKHCEQNIRKDGSVNDGRLGPCLPYVKVLVVQVFKSLYLDLSMSLI